MLVGFQQDAGMGQLASRGDTRLEQPFETRLLLGFKAHSVFHA